MLETEQQFYLDHRDELREKYLGKRVAIVEDQILGVFDNDRQALDAMIAQGYEPGAFMVKYIPADPEDEYVVIPTLFMMDHAGA